MRCRLMIDASVKSLASSGVKSWLVMFRTSEKKLMVAPLPVPDDFRQFDLWVMLGSSAFLLAFVMLRLPINRLAGLVLASGYVAYIVTVI